MKRYKKVNAVKSKLIFCRYIIKNGRIIYPKNAKYFRFWVEADTTGHDAA